MNRNVLKKVLCTLLIVITLFSMCFTNKTEAHSELKSAYLSKIGQANYHLKYRFASGTDYLICSVVGHYINGQFYPAYCVNSSLDGAEKSPYTVAINRALDNDQVWRILTNAYPYKTPEQMGLSQFDAFCVTKMAVYCVLGEANIDKFVADSSDATAVAMLAKLKELVNIGKYGTATMQKGTLTSNKVGEFTESGNYYYQEYSINSGIEISSYSITATAKFPNGTYIGDTAGTEKSTFNGSEHFRIYVPKTALVNNISGDVAITAKAKTYPILYGESGNSKLQNYVITSDPYGDESIVVSMNVETATGMIRINKTDSETSKPIAGVTFELQKEDGTVIRTGTTNANGVINFDKLIPGKYKIKETATNEKYILNQSTFDVDVEFNKTTTKDVLNDHKKGNVKVYKVDKDNHKIVLGNVSFDLFSHEFQKVIGTYTTDVNGEIEIKDLRIGNYSLIEKNTGKWYNLSDDTEVEVKWNETTEKLVENELKKGQVKVIKVDKDNNEIKLKDVKFDVLDENDNVLETIITDENGEATTSKYAIRDYNKIYLKETETQEEYRLSDEVKEIVLEENQIKNIQFENEVKKGQIKVVKIDKDNHEVKLKDVEFEVYDEDNNLIDTLVTDENGEAMTDRIPISKTYTVKETITGEFYKLNEEPQTAILEEDQITTLTFENEKKKGKIEVIKVDEEDNEVKLEGVKFEILDKDGNVVDTVITDSEGKATTKKLPIDNEYTVRESETKKEYVLSDKTEKVVLEEDEIKSITFENRKKRGIIKILKISNGYSELLNIEDGMPLKGAKFLIMNKEGENLGIYETDENGLIQVDNLLYGEYTIYEVEVPEGYIKDAEPQTVSIEEDGQVAEVTFKNSPVKPELPKTGSDLNLIKMLLIMVTTAIAILIAKKKLEIMED